MQLGKIYTAQANVAGATIIEIEVDIANKGIPSFTIVGMADKSIDESRERIGAALKNCGLGKPKQKKIIVSLSPANLKKEGPAFDLPIALSILLADEEINLSCDVRDSLFVGELSLDGSLKSINGSLSIAYAAQKNGYTKLFVPKENAQEASLLNGLSVYGVNNIVELVEHLLHSQQEDSDESKLLSPTVHTLQKEERNYSVDFSHVIEQTAVKRALTIAAAGRHNIGMYGPPGTGKTMLAQAFCSILPTLSRSEQIETTMIYSYAGILSKSVVTEPPLRSPHHTSSYVAVIGGGAHPKPGEVTFAHNGVLFLDEFPEFDKRVLESLREPLESNKVHIARAKGSVTFPADFILVAALNPPSEVYRSGVLITPADERRFKKKLSGPIMDRIDMWIEVPKIDHALLLNTTNKEEPSSVIKKRVIKARTLQHVRLGDGKTNSSLGPQNISTHAHITDTAKELLDSACEKLQVSPRVYHKLIKLARTIADLESSIEIQNSHILEALQYRPKDIL